MSPTAEAPPTRATAALTALASLALASIVVATGISLWPLVAVVALTWWTVLWPRVGRLTALGLVANGSLTALLGVLMLTAATGLPTLTTVVAVWLASGVVGAGALLRRSAATRSPASAPDAACLWVPALLGPVVWLSALGTGLATGSVARLSWVMMGDSVTNLSYARAIVDVGGVLTGARQNPVPLPSALIAVSSWAGRGRTVDADLLQHDLTGFVVVWALMIAATCFTAGLAAAVTVGPRHPRLAAAVGALASALPLTWFVSGYAVEFGFFNAHVLLPVLLLCWTVVVGGTRSPAAVLLSLTLASSVALATWTPLVLVPAALGLVVVLRSRTELVATTPRRIALAVGVAQASACAALVALPALRGGRSTLQLDGDVYPLSPWAPVAAASVSVALWIVAVRRREPVAAPVAMLTAACATAIAVLLLVNAGQDTVWGYYPLKLAWLAVVLAMVVLGATAVRLLASGGSPALAAVTCSALAVGTVVGLPMTSRALGDRPTASPLVWVMSGNPFGDEARVTEVLRGADREQPAIRWSDGADGERNVTFWVLRMLSPYPSDDFPLYRLSSSYVPGDVDDLCRITRAVHPGLTIRTADVALGDRLERVCPGHPGRVIVTRR